MCCTILLTRRAMKFIVLWSLREVGKGRRRPVVEAFVKQNRGQKRRPGGRESGINGNGPEKG
jgi:hypothetical protein